MTDETSSDVPGKELLMELLPHLELTGVHFLELGARRLDYADDDVPGMFEGFDDDNVPALGVAARQTDEQLVVKVQGGIDTDKVRVMVTAAATFAKSKPLMLDGPMTSVFIERVAIMAIYPFIRQAVHDMTSRVGAPATLHLLRAGQVNMTDEQYDALTPDQPEPSPGS